MKTRKHDHPIHKATFRAGLPARREPYWRGLGRGRAIGFRKLTNGGTWIARWTDKGSDYHYKRLGEVPETTHDEARKLAEEWFEQCSGGVIRSGTVSDACKRYVEKLRRDKGERPAGYAEGYFTAHVHDKPLGAIKLDELAAEDLRSWLSDLVQPGRKRNSANRIFRSLKAALNFAFRERMCVSDSEWRRVKPLLGDGSRDEQRTAYLTPEHRRLLLSKTDTDTANFIRAMLYSAARPNEIQAARVADFDSTEQTLRLMSRKGTGADRQRHVPLTPSAVAFFKQLSRGKLPGASLVTYQNYPWVRHAWAGQIRAALTAANKEIEDPKDRLPLDVVAYTMRHCAITDMLRAGVGIGDVAKIAGTSIAMISSFYFKFVVTDVREKLEKITAF